ncbi:DNA-binding protein [Gammaproteobacteria bacterium]
MLNGDSMNKTEAEKRIVISDAGPLIHLDELDRLDILNYQEILVPDAVWREVAHHRPHALQCSAIRLMPRTVTTLPSEVIALSPLFGLHLGEQEALALCIENPNCLLLTDDSAARLAAENLKVSAHGTIGLLIRAIRLHLYSVQEGLKLLTEIPVRSTLHIRSDLLARIIRQVVQEFV